MSGENVEVVRRSWAAMDRGDLAEALSYLDEAIEWEPAEDEPDARIARGVAEVASLLAEWYGSFEDFSGAPEDFIDAGGHVVVPIVFTGRPHGSDAVVTVEETQVYTVRDGRIVRVREYRTKAEALAALGPDGEERAK